MKTIITDRWNNFLNQFDEECKDIYYQEEYVKLYESGGNAFCAVCIEDNNILLMPFIRNEINGFWDFETAYGYGGPIANTSNKEWINIALREMQYLFESENYLCGFIRFHTLLDNAKLCEGEFPVMFDRKTVYINTAESEQEIWMNQISSKNRNMIRKAERNGLEYKAEYEFESLKEFIKLYNATMERLNAEAFYYFDKRYYKNFVENLKGKAFLGTVRKDGKLICGALFMYSEVYGHYHLEGSDYRYSGLAANNLLLWKTSLEFHRLGVKEFHLGGGYNSDVDNSLLKFKKSFSKNMKDFSIGKWIFKPKSYEDIKTEWEKENPEKIETFGHYLLCYKY